MLFRQAAEREHAPAQKNLGQMYQLCQGVRLKTIAKRSNGIGGRRNKGTLRAQYNLGAAYAEGRGVTQDWVKAHMWFQHFGNQR